MKDKYDLSSVEAISASAKLACAHANQEPSQDSYNAGWLHGYADALADVTRQLETTRTSPKKHKRKDASHER